VGDPARIKTAIQAVIQTMMDRVMENVLTNDPFIEEEHRAKKPLYAALVPDAIFKGAHFERRFVTPFGGVWEKLALVAAKEGLGFGACGKVIEGPIRSERLRRIGEVLAKLEHPEKGKSRVKPDWESELAYVLKGGGEPYPAQVVCDVYVEDVKTKERFAFELKAPLPNSDQTKVSKEKILKLYSMEPRQVDAAFFALPYNPYGKREAYAWSFPARWFDMQRDSVVLIGNEFWDKIGGRGTYQSFIDAVNEIGPEYQSRIFKEYLGLDPPPDLVKKALLREQPKKPYGIK
jgi:type II restriction endonuclease TdeIII